MCFMCQLKEVIELKAQKQRVQKRQRQFDDRHCAVLLLRSEHFGAPLDHHLAKRIAQGRCKVEWAELYAGCMRLTIGYRGNKYRIRTPVSVLKELAFTEGDSNEN